MYLKLNTATERQHKYSKYKDGTMNIFQIYFDTKDKKLSAKSWKAIFIIYCKKIIFGAFKKHILMFTDWKQRYLRLIGYNLLLYNRRQCRYATSSLINFILTFYTDSLLGRAKREHNTIQEPVHFCDILCEKPIIFLDNNRLSVHVVNICYLVVVF